MSKIKYCLPIIKTKRAEVLSEIKLYPSYDFYELWLDYLEDLDEVFITKILGFCSDKLIFLFRRKHLETPSLPLQRQHEIMTQLDNTDAYLDLDISQKEALAFVKNETNNIRLITSYHNYDHTPEDVALIKIISTMQKYNPAIIKLATFCKSESDALRLLQLLIQLKVTDKKYIILGMGESGTITRLAGALWGNEINFAPNTKKGASAPGQLTKQELEKLLSLLSTRN